MKNNQLEQLLTELTPEESAVVEGGATLEVRYLFPNGTPSENDPAILVGTSQIFYEQDVNDTRSIFISVPFDGNTTLSLWDKDLADGEGGSDLLGYVNLSSTPTGVQFLETTDYDVTYQVL